MKLARRFPHAVLPARILSLRLHPFHVFFVLCLRQDLTVHACGTGTERTEICLPAFASQLLQIKACATTPSHRCQFQGWECIMSVNYVT